MNPIQSTWTKYSSEIPQITARKSPESLENPNKHIERTPDEKESEHLRLEKIISGFCKEFARLGRIKQAYEKAEEISNPSLKNSTIKEIHEIAAKYEQQIDQNFETAKQISDPTVRDPVIKATCIKLVENEEIDLALEEAMKTSDNLMKSSDLRIICNKFTTSGQINQAIEQLKWISSPLEKKFARGGICIELAKRGQIYEAVQQAKQILPISDEDDYSYQKFIMNEIYKQMNVNPQANAN